MTEFVATANGLLLNKSEISRVSSGSRKVAGGTIDLYTVLCKDGSSYELDGGTARELEDNIIPAGGHDVVVCVNLHSDGAEPIMENLWVREHRVLAWKLGPYWRVPVLVVDLLNGDEWGLKEPDGSIQGPEGWWENKEAFVASCLKDRQDRK